MGQVPNRHPIYMSEIAAALGGTHDLGWYRGKQYWNASGAVVYISQSPSMAEFQGLTNNPPYLSQHTFASRWDGNSVNGFSDGFFGVYGDFQPRAAIGGQVAVLSNDHSNGSTLLVVTGNLPQAAFTTMEIVGLVSLASASASYSQGFLGPNTAWSWVTGNIIGATDYTVNFR